MSKPEIGKPLFMVHAEAVPVKIAAHQLGPGDFRIRLGRGIGWAPTRYKTMDQVLRALLAMRSYGVNEARMCKAICKPDS